MRTKLWVPAALAAILFLAVSQCSKKKASGGDADMELREAEQAVVDAAERSAARGWLEVKGAGLEGQEVRKAGTEEKVELVSATRSVVALPPGTYDVVFGKGLWTGVAVQENGTTTLVPGWITVSRAALEGHAVEDAATGLVHGHISPLADTMALVPGRYIVMFGRLGWPVEVRSGETLVLRPGTVEVPYADVAGHRIFDRAGAPVAEVSNIKSAVPLPPGEYEIEIGERRIPFTLREGDALRFDKE